MRILKRQILDELSEELCLISTSGTMAEGIVQGLTWWLLESDAAACPRAPGFEKVYCSEVWATAAYSTQTQLRWNQFLRGRLSSLWSQAFAKHHHSPNIKETRDKWNRQVVWKIWQASFRLWNNKNEVLHGSGSNRLYTWTYRWLIDVIKLIALSWLQEIITFSNAQWKTSSSTLFSTNYVGYDRWKRR